MAGKSTIRAELDSMESSSEESNSVGNHTPGKDPEYFAKDSLFFEKYTDILEKRKRTNVLDCA